MITICLNFYFFEPVQKDNFLLRCAGTIYICQLPLCS
uniref:Uncharacterized protein n=1 Tax=Arundo donax TaxID=35708 RepID=A0A0A8Y1H8_ARUDO